jgi:peptide/nickel transport system substrate-binding protein
MSKRIVRLMSIVLSLVMMLSLIGCANGSTGTSSTPTQSGSETSSTPAQSGSETPAGPARSKIVNIGETQKFRGLDPQQAQDTGTTAGLLYMYEPLITVQRYYEGDGTGPADEVGLLAESWEVAPDQTYWIFHLRKNVYFHNGQLFTADDVVCTFQRLIDNRDKLNVAITEWALLKSVEKIDDYTVKVNFTQPYAWASANFQATYIFPHEAYEEMGDDLWNKQLCYGTGPWILEEWVDGQYLHFKKNPNYWDKEHYDPYFDELYHRYIAEPATGVAAMLSGNLDVLSSPSGIDWKMLPQFNGTEDKIELIKRDTVFYYYIQFKMDPSNVFGDENVRRAFDLSIDRQTLVDGIFGGQAYVNIGGYYGPGVDGNDPSLVRTYDPDQAKTLLAASAYKGQELTLCTNQSMPKAEEFALAVADMAKQVGFNIKVYTDETSVYATRRTTGDYDMFVGYNSINNIPGGARRDMNQITTDQYKSGMAANPNYDFEKVQSLIADYYVAKSPEIAHNIAKEFNQYMFEHVGPKTEILFLKATNAQARGITGIRYTDAGIQGFKYVDWDPSKLQ